MVCLCFSSVTLRSPCRGSLFFCLWVFTGFSFLSHIPTPLVLLLLLCALSFAPHSFCVPRLVYRGVFTPCACPCGCCVMCPVSFLAVLSFACSSRSVASTSSIGVCAAACLPAADKREKTDGSIEEMSCFEANFLRLARLEGPHVAFYLERCGSLSFCFAFTLRDGSLSLCFRFSAIFSCLEACLP